tara:strand:+ start:57 stop:608 length:552 start_codon:yes stop_codon:yes gene_type:complete
MKILELLPKGARQIRYIHPHYDYQEDDEGNVVDEYCINEDICTNVWYECVDKVHKTKRAVYYRRRTNDLAKDDVRRYGYDIAIHNQNNETWGSEYCRYVRVRRLGRRVMFIYDEQHMKKIWLKTKRKLDLDKANRKRKVLKLTPEFTPELKEFSYEDIDTKLGELARDYYSIMRGETEDEYNS